MVRITIKTEIDAGGNKRRLGVAFDSDMSIKAIEKTLEIIEKQTLKQIISNL